MVDRSDIDLGQQSGTEWTEASENNTTEADQLAQAATSTADSAAQPDDQPVVKSELNETVIVDEDDLPNATGDQDSPGDLNPQFTTGTLEGSVGNDVPATFTLLDTGSPDGYTYKVVGDVLTISDGAKAVLEVSLKDPATGEYRVDLLDKIDQQAGPQPKFETNKDFTVSYRVTDADGDYADGKFVVRVNDDIPVSEEFQMDQLSIEQQDEVDRSQFTQVVEASKTTPVILPAGAQIVGILANGNDLFIRLADGSLIQVIDGLKIIPTIVLGDGNEVPSESLAAALQANGVVLPAAGEEGVQSSGGTFDTAGQFVTTGFDENPLLPPTAFDREFSGFIETGGFIEPLTPPQILSINGGPLQVADPALPDGTDPTSEAETYVATVEIQAGTGTVNQLFFLPDLSGIQVVGMDPTLTIQWSFDNPATGVEENDPQVIYGSINNEPVLQVTLQLPSPIAPGEIGQGNMIIELQKGFPHDPSVDLATFSGVPVGIEDSQGQTDEATTGFGVIDDLPQAFDDETNGKAGVQQDYNVIDPDEDGTGIHDPDANEAGEDTTGADLPTVLISAQAQDPSQITVNSINSDGTITFTPAAGFEGETVINYTIQDDDDDTSSATLTVNVNAVIAPTVTSSVGGVPLCIDEDSSGQVTFVAAVANNSDDQLNTLQITGLNQAANYTFELAINDAATFNVVTPDGSGFFSLPANTTSAELRVTIQPNVADSDADLGSLVVEATAMDSDDNTVVSAPISTTVTVTTDAILDETVVVADGSNSGTESTLPQVLSLNLVGSITSPFGQNDGANDPNESGTATVTVTLPAGAVLGTWDGSTFSALAAPYTFTGTATQVDAWIESLAVQVPANYDGTISGSISVTFSDTPVDLECTTANNTASDGASFNVTINSDTNPPTVDSNIQGGELCIDEDGSGTVIFTAKADPATDDVITQVQVTGLVATQSYVINGTTVTGVTSYTVDFPDTNQVETVTIVMTPPADSDLDFGTLVAVATAADPSDLTLTATSAPAQVLVKTDAILDETVVVADGSNSGTESTLPQVLSLNLVGSITSPFGQNDGANDPNESGTATVTVTLPAGAVLGTWDGSTFSALAAPYTFTGTATQVDAWIESLAVQVPANYDGTISGSISVAFSDTPVDLECTTANNTASDTASFNVAIAPDVNPPTVDSNIQGGELCIDEDGSGTVIFTAKADPATDDVITQVQVTGLVATQSYVINGTTVTGVTSYTVDFPDTNQVETVTIVMTPPADSDLDFGTLVAVATAADPSDLTLTATSAPAQVLVKTDAILDETVVVADGSNSGTESTLPQVLSLNLVGSITSPFGQNDGANDPNESGTATVTVTLPAGAVLGTWDGSTFSALAAPYTFTGTATQVDAWIESLAVQVPANYDGTISGSISVTFSDTPVDLECTTANNTASDGASFNVTINSDTNPPTVDSNIQGGELCIDEDGSGTVIFTAKADPATDDVITQVQVTGLVATQSYVINGTTVTGVTSYTVDFPDTNQVETVTIVMTPPADSDLDFGTLVAVATAADPSDLTLTATSAPAQVLVKTDAILDETVVVADGSNSGTESTLPQVLSLNLVGSITSPFGQNDGANDPNESGTATVTVTLPAGAVLGTWDGSTFSALAAPYTFTGTATQVDAWIESLAVQVPANYDGTISGSISVAFSDTPVDLECTTANNTASDTASFNVAIAPDVNPPTVDSNIQGGELCIDEDGSGTVIFTAKADPATDDVITQVQVTGLVATQSYVINGTTVTGVTSYTVDFPDTNQVETVTIVMTPPADSDLDFGTLVAVATAADPSDLTLTATSAPAQVLVKTDAILDETVVVADGSNSGTESTLPQVLSLNLVGSITSPFGQNDGANDPNESGTATVTVTLPAGAVLGTWDGSTFSALAAPYTFTGTATQVDAWIESLAVQVPANYDGTISGSISVTFSDTPVDLECTTANNTASDGASFNVTINSDTNPPTVDSNIQGGELCIDEDGSGTVIFTAKADPATDDVITQVQVTGLVATQSYVINGTTVTGVTSYTVDFPDTNQVETVTIVMTPPADSDLDFGTLVAVATAADPSDLTLTATSAPAQVLVKTDAILDETVVVADGSNSGTESTLPQVLSLNLVGSITSPFGQNDGANDPNESGTATVTVTLPAGAVLGTWDGSTFSALAAPYTFTGTATQVDAWIESLAVQVPANYDGTISGSISVAFSDTPVDLECTTANNTASDTASFNVAIAPDVNPPTVDSNIQGGELCIDEDGSGTVIFTAKADPATDDVITQVQVTGLVATQSYVINGTTVTGVTSYTVDFPDTNQVETVTIVMTPPADSDLDFGTLVAVATAADPSDLTLTATSAPAQVLVKTDAILDETVVVADGSNSGTESTLPQVLSLNLVGSITSPFGQNDGANDPNESGTATVTVTLPAGAVLGTWDGSTFSALAAPYTFTGTATQVDAWIESLAVQVPANYDGTISGSISVAFSDTPVDLECTTANNTASDTASFNVAIAPDVNPPTVDSNIQGGELCIDEDGSGTVIFTAKADPATDDVITQVQVTGLVATQSYVINGTTVTGVTSYTVDFPDTNQVETVTIVMTPPADSDLDFGTLVAVATAADPSDLTLTATSAPAQVLVKTDAILDETVVVADGSNSGTESTLPQVLSLNLVGSITSPFGQNDGANDPNESGTATVTVTLPAGAVLGTWDGSTFSALAAPYTFTGTATQVDAWIESLAVQVPANYDGTISGSISVAFSDTPVDLECTTANNTASDTASFNVAIAPDVNPPTVDSNIQGGELCIDEDGSGTVIFTAKADPATDDVITQVQVTGLVATQSYVINGTTVTGVTSYTVDFPDTNQVETVTIVMTPPADSDLDFGTLVAVATAADPSDLTLTATSAPAQVLVKTDAILDETVVVADGSNSGTESTLPQVLSLNLVGSITSPFGQNDGANDPNESGTATVTVTLPAGAVLGTWDGSTFSALAAPYTFTGTATQVDAWIESLAVQVPANYDGTISGSISVTFSDTPVDLECTTANNTASDGASFNVTINSDTNPPTVDSNIQGGELCIDEDGSGTVIFTAKADPATDDVITQVQVTGLVATQSYVINGTTVTGVTSYTVDFPDTNQVETVTIVMTPPADSDLDFGTLVAVATAADPSDLTLTATSAPAQVLVKTDAILDETVVVADGSNSGTESTLPQVLSLNLVGSITSPFGQNDGANDPNESGTATVTVTLPAGAVLGTWDGSTFSALAAPYTFTGTATQVDAWIESLAVQVPANYDGTISGSISVAFSDTPVDLECTTANNTASDTASFNVAIAPDVNPPTVDSNIQGGELCIDEDGSGTVIFTAKADPATDDVITQVQVTGLVATQSYVINGTTVTGVTSYTVDFPDTNQVETVTIVMTPPADSDLDFGTLVAVATAADPSDLTLTATSAPAQVLVKTDAILDETVVVADGSNSGTESTLPQVLSLNLVGSITSPFGQNDGANDPNESGTATVTVTLPAGAVLGTWDGSTFSALAAPYTFTGTATQVDAWIESLAVQVPANYDGTISGSISVTFSDTPVDLECTTANNTASDGASFNVTINSDTNPPTVDSNIQGGELCIDEDGSGTVIFTAKADPATDDVITQVQVTGLVATQSYVINGTTVTGVTSYTVDFPDTNQVETVTIVMTPPADSDLDFGTLVAVATAADPSDLTLTATSAPAQVLVKTDAILDETVVVADGSNSGTESTLPQVLSLNLVGSITSPFGQNDGANDPNESGTATVTVTLPAGAVLGTWDGSTFSALAAPYTFTGTATQVDAWIESLAVQVPANYDGTISGSISVAFSDTPVDLECTTANNTASDTASFNVAIAPDVNPPTVDSNIQGGELCIDEDGSGTVIFTAKADPATDDVITQVQVTGLVATQSYVINGTTVTGVTSYTVDFPDTNQVETVTIVMTPPADSDLDFGTLVAVATAADPSDLTLTATSAPAQVLVKTDAILDETVVVADGSNSGTESTLPQVLSLNLVGSITSPFGQNDGANDPNESGTATVTVTLPAGAVLGTWDGSTFSALAAPYTFTGTATQVDAWIESLAVQVPASYDGTISGSISVAFSDTPVDLECTTANNTASDTATFTVTVADGPGPIAIDESITVDDEGLFAGIAGLGAGDVPGEDILVEGTLSATPGSDPIATYDFAVMDLQTDTIGQEDVQYHWNSTTNKLTAEITSGSRNGQTLFQLQVNPTTGAYTYLLLLPVVHADVQSENNEIVNLTFTVTDDDGTSDTGAFTITMNDDMPVQMVPMRAVLVNDPEPAAPVIGSASLDFYGNIGADQLGDIWFTGTNAADGALLKDTDGNNITSGGDTITLTGFGTDTLIGTLTNNLSVEVIRFELNESATAESNDLYTVTLSQKLDDGSGIGFADFSNAPAGNQEWTGVDGNLVALDDPTDPDPTSQDILVTPTIDTNLGNNAGGSVNTNNTTMGAGSGQTITTGEGLNIDLVLGLQGSPGVNDGASFYSTGSVGQNEIYHYTTIAGGFTVYESGNNDAVVDISAVHADDDKNGMNAWTGTTNPQSATDTDDVLVQITRVIIVANGVVIDVINDHGPQNVGGGQSVSVDFKPDGTVTVSGLRNGDTVDFETASPFNRMVIEGGTGTDPFNIGGFEFNPINEGSSIDLSLNVTASDADGDTTTADLNIGFSPISNISAASNTDGIALIGDEDANFLTGGTGDDLFTGGAGGDTINGGGGSDWVDYSQAPTSGSNPQVGGFIVTGVKVDLTTNAGTYSHAAGDTYSSIENVIGSAHGDLINGNASDNKLFGGAGNDLIQGGAGSDLLVGGAGNDTITGGTELDVVDYSREDGGGAVIVNLDTSTATDTFGDTDFLTGVEEVIGTNNTIVGDNITGDGNANLLSGLSGDDFLYGLGGEDLLFGGWGNDTLSGGSGADDLTGGRGADTFVLDKSNLTLGQDDTIADYLLAEEDAVDLQGLFDVDVLGGKDIGDYVQVSGDQLQADVSGNASTWVHVATLDTSSGVSVIYDDNNGGADLTATIV